MPFRLYLLWIQRITGFTFALGFLVQHLFALSALGATALAEAWLGDHSRSHIETEARLAQPSGHNYGAAAGDPSISRLQRPEVLTAYDDRLAYWRSFYQEPAVEFALALAVVVHVGVSLFRMAQRDSVGLHKKHTDDGRSGSIRIQRIFQLSLRVVAGALSAVKVAFRQILTFLRRPWRATPLALHRVSGIAIFPFLIGHVFFMRVLPSLWGEHADSAHQAWSLLHFRYFFVAYDLAFPSLALCHVVLGLFDAFSALTMALTRSPTNSADSRSRRSIALSTLSSLQWRSTASSILMLLLLICCMFFVFAVLRLARSFGNEGTQEMQANNSPISSLCPVCEDQFEWLYDLMKLPRSLKGVLLPWVQTTSGVT